MRTCLSVLILSVSSVAFTQKKSDPFIGGFELGIGYGSIIDFDPENNNFHREYFLERLIWLPFKFGIVTAKYLNTNEYLEFGMTFARRSSSFVYYHNYGPYGHHSIGLTVICLYSIDVPITYYKYVGPAFNKHFWAYGGLIPSWIAIPDVASNEDWDNMLENIRDASLSICGGLCYEKKNVRIKYHAGLTVTSIVNSSYRDIPDEKRLYGKRIHPFELMLDYTWMLR